MNRRVWLLFSITVLAVGLLPFPRAAAGGFCHEGGNTMAKTSTVDMKENCYSPAVVQIPAGGKVTWTNSDPEAHMVLGVGGSWGAEYELGVGESATLRFDNPGVFPYWCHLHLGMVGAVVVGDGRPGADKGAGPIATTIATSSGDGAESAPVASTKTLTPARRDRPEGSGGVTPVAVAGIAAVTGAAGFGLARRRRVP